MAWNSQVCLGWMASQLWESILFLILGAGIQITRHLTQLSFHLGSGAQIQLHILQGWHFTIRATFSAQSSPFEGCFEFTLMLALGEGMAGEEKGKLAPGCKVA